MATASPNSNLNGLVSEDLSFQVNLTPLKKPKRAPKFAVVDLESKGKNHGKKTGWVDFLIAGYYDDESGVSTFTDMNAFLDHCFDSGRKDLFFHFGGIYDFLHVLQNVFESDRFQFENIIPRGSGALCLSISRGADEITFRDSSALLPFGLETLGKTFGTATQKGKINYDDISVVTPELVKYLEADLLSLYQVLDRFYSLDLIRASGAKYTMASQSMQVFRRYLKEPIPSLTPTVDSYVRTSYAGGRTEIFRPVFDGPGILKNYDINSLYPYVMRNNDFPTHFEEWSPDLDLDRMGFHDVKVKVKDGVYLPILWTKKPKFIFPTGEFWGVYSTPELKAALDSGQAKILRHRKSAYFANGGPIFREFVDDLYARRLAAKDDGEKTILKLILNSTYGRFGIRLERESLEWDNGQEGVSPVDYSLAINGKVFRFVRRETKIKTFSNCAIASYVTAYARLENHRYLEKFADTIHYTDTDSFFTTARVDNGKDLGQLKLEYTAKKACFLLPKTYVADGLEGLKDKDGNSVPKKLAMKGFDRRKIQHFTYDDFMGALEGEMKLKIKDLEPTMFRLKSAMARGSFLQIKNGTEKQVRSKYDKREFFRDAENKWDSRPLKILEK